ncbi:MAG: glycosyl hydrolase [Cyclobacteriaceae bacterium]|nr:glycosyl hydrolase [Cyclobacteriaceae bacterium]
MRKNILFLLITMSSISWAQRNRQTTNPVENKKEEVSLSGLKFRNIGPSVTSGRIADFAVNPNNYNEYYVATASGGVWKTINAGTSYQPIFDSQGSYSIGCVTLDPGNSNVVWVGSGENNNQRSVAYGDGVYKSEDAGASWKNMGLKTSEHIGRIIVDPTNSNTVYVAALGPLWKEGGERGVYKTTDGGKTWNQVLKIDQYTGVNDIVMDPRDPNILYASAHQRMRSDYAYVSGGPGSGMYKTTNGGTQWDKVNNGLPTSDMGRIGLAISPADPEYIYAIVEAAKDEGFYRSTTQGAKWEKMSSHQTGGNYYNEVIADPKNKDRVYTMGYAISVSDDGGKNFRSIGEDAKHVDNHALWVNPANTNHMRNGCDGGIYETWDGAKTWQFKSNLPVTQFYKVEVDNTEPFYYVYGGTQDNFSLGGPSRTRSENGIVNDNWFVTQGGDGFESAIDPFNVNIVYAQSQHGGLTRYDKATGENMGIQPQPRKGEKEYRWNWDAPLQTSPHKSGRLYIAANKIFKSDDYGNTWQVISEDVTRNEDRNKLPIMGRVWGIDATGKNDGVAPYGTVSALSESPKNENLIVIGTDDGLVQITTDGGKIWKKTESFAGAPSMTYVYHILTSQHDENVIYTTLNNHKRGDFKPYIYKSTNKGQTWASITANLPERGSTYSIAEDHVDANLLFVGTEFGVHFSNDGGASWKPLKGGLPTIAVRDMAIQKRENDLVLATFGRGFYILDDYSPLRNINQTENKEGYVFPIKDSWMFVESTPLGIRGKGFQGESYFNTPNPQVGAVFTYYFRDDLKTNKEKRQEEESKLAKGGKDVNYPSYDRLKEEEGEDSPYLLFTVKNEKGDIIRKLKAPTKKGINRITWDFRYPSSNPIDISPKLNDNPFQSDDVGQLAAPGNYTLSMSKYVDGVLTEIIGGEKFIVKVLPGTTLPATDRPALVAWQRQAAELQRSIEGTSAILRDANQKVKYLKEAVFSVSEPNQSFAKEILDLENKLRSLQDKMFGDRVASQLDIDREPSINSRLSSAIYSGYGSTSEPTTTMKNQLQWAGEEYDTMNAALKQVIEKEIPAIEKKLEGAGAPYTPGRMPEWKKN